MRIKNRLFNHPVLSSFSDDYLNSRFELDLQEIDSDSNLLELSYLFTLENDSIRELLDENKAYIGFFVECPKTSYRKFIKVDDLYGIIRFESSLIKEKIDIQGFVMTNDLILNFEDVDFNPIYASYAFNIREKSILAYTHNFKITLSFDDDELGQVSSVFKVIKKNRLEDDKIELTFDEKYIKIFISENKYLEYTMIKNMTKQNQDLMHSILIIPALIQAFTLIKSEENIDYFDQGWFYSLKTAFESKGYDFNQVLKTYSEFDLANIVMESSTLRSFTSLTNILKVSTEESDDL